MWESAALEDYDNRTIVVTIVLKDQIGMKAER